MLFRTTSDNDAFTALADQFLNRMQKQCSKQRSTISMLKKIFRRHLNVFNIFADTADNFITVSSLHLAGPVYTNFSGFL